MTEAELKNKINDLRDRIAEHQTEIHRQETRQTGLTKPPRIPAGATGQQLAKIFETHAGFDDLLLGTQAALAELQRRQNRLSSELQQYATELHRLQEQNRRVQLTRSVLAELNN